MTNLNSTFGISKENGYLGETTFIRGVLARVAVICFIGPTDLFVPETNLGEVKVVGWEIPARLANYSLRVGVKNVWGECQDIVSAESRFNDLWPLSLAYLHMVNTE